MAGRLFELQSRNGILEEKDRRLYEYAYGVLLGRVVIYLIEKQAEWLEACKNGIDFIEKYCFDTDGRMFYEVTKTGTPVRKTPICIFRNVCRNRHGSIFDRFG